MYKQGMRHIVLIINVFHVRGVGKELGTEGHFGRIPRTGFSQNPVATNFFSSPLLRLHSSYRPSQTHFRTTPSVGIHRVACSLEVPTSNPHTTHRAQVCQV